MYSNIFVNILEHPHIGFPLCSILFSPSDNHPILYPSRQDCFFYMYCFVIAIDCKNGLRNIFEQHSSLFLSCKNKEQSMYVRKKMQSSLSVLLTELVWCKGCINILCTIICFKLRQRVKLPVLSLIENISAF